MVELACSRELGHTDSADQVFRDLTNHLSPNSKKNDRDMMRAYADISAETMEWLEENGVRFIDIVEVTPLPGVDPGRYHLASWDEEGTPRSPGRLYKFGKGTHSGAGVFRPLEEAARRKGVRFLLQHSLTRVVREGDRSGRVVGVEASAGGRTVRSRPTRVSSSQPPA